MIEKLKDSFFNEVEKRFKNPFLGAFALSWIFWNWDFIYVILFLDEQYVSIIPEVSQIPNNFITKFEYIKNENIVNIWKSFIHPLWTSLLVIIFVEWVTTFLNILIKKVRYGIEKKDLLTKEESQEMKEKLIDSKNGYVEKINIQNEQILSLEAEKQELELKIDDKVNKKLEAHQEKNLKRIEELKNNLNNSEKVSSERLEKNKFLEENLNNVNITLVRLNNDKQDIEKKYRLLSNEHKSLNKLIDDLKIENNDLKKNLEKLDSPLDEKYKNEYNEFRKTSFFNNFDNFIDEIEENPYDIKSKFFGKDIKYLKVKGIIETEEEEDNYGMHIKTTFTPKGDKFVEYYLDEYSGTNNSVLEKKQEKGGKKEEEISVEDLPF